MGQRNQAEVGVDTRNLMHAGSVTVTEIFRHGSGF